MSDIKKAEKKKNILNIAMALFQKNTVAATAVDDIVKSAGIARGTFYLYFKDKSDLLEQVIMMKSRETMLAVMGDSYSQATLAGADFISVAAFLLERYINCLCDSRDTLCILKKNISSIMRNAPDFGDERANEFFERIVHRMTEYGYTRENAVKTVYVLVDMVGSVCSDAILTGKPFSIEEIRPFVIESSLTILRNGRTENKEEINDNNTEGRGA